MDQHDPIDRVLTEEAAVQPSPGFAHRVMREVHRTAEEPRPIPFPWRLFVVGTAAGAVLLLLLVIAVAQRVPAAATGAPSGPVALGLTLAVGSVIASLLLAGRLATVDRRTGY